LRIAKWYKREPFGAARPRLGYFAIFRAFLFCAMPTTQIDDIQYQYELTPINIHLNKPCSWALYCPQLREKEPIAHIYTDSGRVYGSGYKGYIWHIKIDDAKQTDIGKVDFENACECAIHSFILSNNNPI